METIDRNLLTFLLNSLWQVPLVAIVAALACRLMRNGPARHRHAVCVAGLIAAVLLPVASMRRGSADIQTIGVAADSGSDVAGAANRAARGRSRSRRPERCRCRERLRRSRCGASRSSSACAWDGSPPRDGRRSGSAATRAPGGDCPAWDRCRAAFALDDVELRWSSTISGPVTAGKLVILPIAMQGAPDDVLATAIGHELAHIARRDFAFNAVYELLCLPISFQPATAWLRRHIDRTRELACDELVTTRLLAPEVYARSIMDIAATMSGVARPGYTLGVFDGDILEERIKRLVHRPAANLKRARMLLAAALAGMAACIVIASTLAITARAQTPAQQEMRQAGDAYNSGDFASATEHFKKAVVARARQHQGAAVPRRILSSAGSAGPGVRSARAISRGAAPRSEEPHRRIRHRHAERRCARRRIARSDDEADRFGPEIERGVLHRRGSRLDDRVSGPSAMPMAGMARRCTVPSPTRLSAPHYARNCCRTSKRATGWSRSRSISTPGCRTRWLI